MLVSLAEIRAEGLSQSESADARVLATLDLAAELIRLITQQTFEVLTYTADSPLLVDGTGIDTLPLPVPVLRLDSVVDGWDQQGLGANLNLADLKILSESRPRDDRRYPRIVKSNAVGALYYAGSVVGGLLPNRWMRGTRNVALAGVFGYLDGRWRGEWNSGTTYQAGDLVTVGTQDYLALTSSTNLAPANHASAWQTGAAPAPIRRVAILLVLREYRLLTDPMYAASVSKGRLQSETTDMHSYTLGGLIASAGLTGDPVIDDILTIYRRRHGGTTGSAW